jgi:hypothetical protein
MKFKDKNRIQDPRIKKKTMTWLGILLTYFVLLVLSAGQAMVLAEYMGWGQDGKVCRSNIFLECLVIGRLSRAFFA